MLLLPHARVGEGSKAAPCGRGQFESPASPKNDASGPEQVSGAIIAAPPCKVSSNLQSFNRDRQAVDLIDFFSVTS